MLSPSSSHRLIEKEMSRSDRLCDPLGLIVLTSNDSTPAIIDDAASYLENRLRKTDDYGLLSENEFAVILPHTPSNGVEVVAADLRQELSEEHSDFDLTIYSYPSDWLIGDGTNEDNSQHTEEDTEKTEAQPAELLFLEGLPVWKRVLDIIGASVALVVLFPFFLLVACLIRFTSRGPILFSQERSGLGGKPFRMLKFRSMVVDAEERKSSLISLNEQDGPAFKLKNDPRVTRIGRFLRVTSLDELPQLVNVLRGEMSLVGPRPLPCNETYECTSWQRQRLKVTPGITCFWQVEGRSKVAFADWMRMDLDYIKARSLKTDLQLIFKTFWSVIVKRNGC